MYFIYSNERPLSRESRAAGNGHLYFFTNEFRTIN